MATTIIIIVLGISGFLISLYSYYIERALKRDSSYRPVCDLSDRISCSKPILSQYGHLLGIENAIPGMLYYLMIVILAFIHAPIVFFALTVMAGIVTLYLAWALYFKIRAWCPLCLAIYLINILLLILGWYLVK